MSDTLVSANKYSKDIKLLNPVKCIETNIPILVRDKVAKMLAVASKKLPKGYWLQVDGGYRSPEVQRYLWDNRVKQLGLNKAKLLVGNPEKGTPGHTTGGAVDVSILDNKFKEVNLSAPFAKYYNEQRLYSRKITKKAQKLRLTLYKAMVSTGFAPHNNEYWHFSYGDNRWARYYNKKPLYNQVKNSKQYYYPLFVRYFYKIIRRIYKVKNYIFKLKTNY